MGYSGYSGYSGYPQLQNPRIGPAGKSPCEVARELRDQALESCVRARLTSLIADSQVISVTA